MKVKVERWGAGFKLWRVAIYAANGKFTMAAAPMARKDRATKLARALVDGVNTLVVDN